MSEEDAGYTEVYVLIELITQTFSSGSTSTRKQN